MCVFSCGSSLPYDPKAGEWTESTTISYINPHFNKKHLTQADIDAPETTPVRLPWFKRVLEWLSAPAGAILTILVLLAFVAGCWGAMLLWQMRGR